MDIKEYVNKEDRKEIIKKFLEGSDEQKYITGIEGDYYNNEVTLMIEDPEKGKYMEKHKFTPFCFIKDFKLLNKKLYNTESELKEAMKIHGISIKKLRTDSHPRLEYGYKYQISTSKQLKNIIQFFSKAGYDVFDRETNLFICNPGPEQFLLTSGKRLFKGFDSYNDIHKFYFDIETTGLNPLESHTFLIGMKDNRGFRKVLEIDLNNPLESEKQMIIDFFQTIMDLKPAIVAGYNSEAFDFHFLIERANILGIELGTRKDEDNNWIYDVRTSFRVDKPLKRKEASVKFGGDTEKYVQTIMWGTNVIDISHGVRKAMAINSDIKEWKLKYICKFSGVAAENRMYVPDGNKIYKIWEENQWYFINKKNNNYKIIHPNQQATPEKYKEKLKLWVEQGKNEDALVSVKKTRAFFDNDVNNVDIISGKEIIYQYLLDDLSETEMVDNRFNEPSFMLGGIAPTSFSRVSTMGNAALWKLLMLTYSFHNNLAIPINDVKRDIVGGLSRLLRTGYAKNIVKFDYTSLYPGIQLTHDVFPDLDITGVLEAMLTYFRDARIEFKGLKEHYKELGDMTLSKFFDTKQLPIKILANSNFGALSSPALFNWGDNNIGERITCTGRQYLRLMVYHFMQYDFLPLVGDTDGINYSIPDNADDIKYTNKKGEELTGYRAVLAEFNEKYMKGVMNLEEDGLYPATINFSRKNYANLTKDGKVKLTGASIKSKTIQTYIVEFIDTGVKLLLYNNGKDFVEEYYKHLTIIYNGQIPLIKIANKDKIKQKVVDYQWRMANVKQKNGRPLSRQAHMELMIQNNLDPDLGEVIYHINNGTKKNDGNLNNSYLIDFKELEVDPEKIGPYNVAYYVKSFNDKVKPLLVAFQEEVRKQIIVDNPQKRGFFTEAQLELVNGVPVDIEDQDPIYVTDYISGKGGHQNVPLFEMTEPEINFWNRTGLDPYEIFEHFTTELSDTRLLTQEEHVTKKIECQVLKDFFKSNGSTVKTEMDFLLDGENIIRYGNKLIQYVKNTDEATKKNKPWNKEETKLEEFRWILSKFEAKYNGRFNDLEIIDKEIYQTQLIEEETANQ